MDNQHGLAVWHRELCSVLCNSLDRKGVWGEWIPVMRTAESFRFPPETTTTLFTSYEVT